MGFGGRWRLVVLLVLKGLEHGLAMVLNFLALLLVVDARWAKLDVAPPVPQPS